MANKFPLTLNTVDKQIEELPSGDNLNLTGAAIISVGDITSTGAIEAASITVGGVDITTLGFSGDYDDLTNKPVLPINLSDLVNDVGFLTAQTDSQTIGLVGNTLSISNGNSISLTSILPTDVSQLINDVGYITDITLETINELSDVSTIDATDGQALIYNATQGEWEAGTLSVLFNITGDDSTVRTIAPGSIIQISGLGDINTASDADADIVISNTSTLATVTDRGSSTTNAIEVGGLTTTGVLRMASFTTAERNALTAANGDVIYNTDDNKFQGYENGGWANLI
jgi:hypothetical protein